jgi:hypothetical protein
VIDGSFNINIVDVQVIWCIVCYNDVTRHTICCSRWEHIMINRKCCHKYYFSKVCFWTSTMPILNGLLISCIHNKVIQNPTIQLSKETKFVDWY